MGFAAVTIKPSKPENPNSKINFDQGRFSVENQSMLSMIQEAYGLSFTSMLRS